MPQPEGNRVSGPRLFHPSRARLRRDSRMPGGRAVVASQPVAPIIPRAALLRQTRGWLEGAGVGVHAEIAATDIYLQGKWRGGPACVPGGLAPGVWGGLR